MAYLRLAPVKDRLTFVFTTNGTLVGQITRRQSAQPCQRARRAFSTTHHQYGEGNPASRAAGAQAKKAEADKKAEAERKSKPERGPTSQENGKPNFYASTPPNEALPEGWDDKPDYSISNFSQLPHKTFGYNQHIQVNDDFKEALRQILWKFKAPIRYAFAYGSGVFTQSPPGGSYEEGLSPHPHPPDAIVKWQSNGGKVIDFIFGVSFTQHWHSINLQEHRDHYSFLGSLGSGWASSIQDSWGAGVYFNPYITVNGTMIKYGVVNLDTITEDLSEWRSLYLAGRLHKPVKILRDDARVRLANQVNLISAVRTALLMLPERFTEKQLYETITGLSYLGDPRVRFKSESPNKIKNIVDNQLPNFRLLYNTLIDDLPNVQYTDARLKDGDWLSDDTYNSTLQQDMNPTRRGNMVRRLPTSFRNKVYFLYQRKFGIPGREYAAMLEASKDEDALSFKRREGGEFDRRIAGEKDIPDMMAKAIRQTVEWPSASQSIKGLLTAGPVRSWRYLGEKRKKGQEKVRVEKSKGTEEKN